MPDKMRIVKECYVSKSYLNYLINADKNGLTEYEISLLDDLISLGDFIAVDENTDTCITRCAISDLIANCSLITIFKKEVEQWGIQ